MRVHRLKRLSQLTQGLALVGLGIAEQACTKNDPSPNGPAPEQPHINAPPNPPEPSAPPSATATAPEPSTSASAPTLPTPSSPPKPPKTNAPNKT